MYSIIGSFYLPLALMVGVYYKIYQAARLRARRSLVKPPAAATTTSSSRGSERCCRKSTEMKCLSFVRKGCASANNTAWGNCGIGENIRLSEYRASELQPIEDCSSTFSAAATGDEADPFLLAERSVALGESAQVNSDVTCSYDVIRDCNIARDFSGDCDDSHVPLNEYTARDYSVTSDCDWKDLRFSTNDIELHQLESRSSTALLPLITNRTLTSDDSGGESAPSDKISPFFFPRESNIVKGAKNPSETLIPDLAATSVNSRLGIRSAHDRISGECHDTGDTFCSRGVTSSGHCSGSRSDNVTSSTIKARTFVAYETRRRKIKCTLAPDFNFRNALSAARGGGAGAKSVARQGNATNAHQVGFDSLCSFFSVFCHMAGL